jgi:hypothetical protein
MRFELKFDPQRASEILRGVAAPLPEKCVEGYRIADFLPYPGFVAVVMPSRRGETDEDCKMELEFIALGAATEYLKDPSRVRTPEEVFRKAALLPEGAR